MFNCTWFYELFCLNSKFQYNLWVSFVDIVCHTYIHVTGVCYLRATKSPPVWYRYKGLRWIAWPADITGGGEGYNRQMTTTHKTKESVASQKKTFV